MDDKTIIAAIHGHHVGGVGWEGGWRTHTQLFLSHHDNNCWRNFVWVFISSHETESHSQRQDNRDYEWRRDRKTHDSTHNTTGQKHPRFYICAIMSKPHEIAWQVRTPTVWNIHKKYKIIYQTFLAPRYIQLQMHQSAHHVWKLTQEPDGKNTGELQHHWVQ